MRTSMCACVCVCVHVIACIQDIFTNTQAIEMKLRYLQNKNLILYNNFYIFKQFHDVSMYKF